MSARHRREKAALCQGVQQVSEEAAGALNVFVVRPIDGPALVADAIAGDPEASCILQGISQAQTRILAAPAREPMLCASCPAPLRDGRYSFVVALPAKDSPLHAIGLGVCPACGTDPAVIQAKGIEALRRIWPNLRSITPTHPHGGRA